MPVFLDADFFSITVRQKLDKNELGSYLESILRRYELTLGDREKNRISDNGAKAFIQKGEKLCELDNVWFGLLPPHRWPY